MATVIVQAVASLDGFIARPDDLPGPIFDWYEAGDVELTFNPAHVFHVSQQSADYLDGSDSRCQVIGRHLFDFTDGWGGLPIVGRPRLRGDPSRRRRRVEGSATPMRRTRSAPTASRTPCAAHRARRRRDRRRLRRRGRRTGRRGRARRRAGDRAGAGVPGPGQEVPRLVHRRDRPRRPARGRPGRARACTCGTPCAADRGGTIPAVRGTSGWLDFARDRSRRRRHVAPRHWEADVLLRDGRTAHIRPIRPDDADLLVDFYSRVSDQSKYYRFFSPMPHLSERDVARFTQVDHVHRVAFVMLLSERMIALGSYEGHASTRTTGDPAEVAEVAFLVEDAQQGRGIGQLLLEHLAQAGRERGIERFVAEVLPDNQRMIQTFRDAGYRLVSGFEDGVITLEFPIEPTDTAIGVMASREHRAEAASIETFFNPRSVAVIGASRRQDTVGQALVRNLVLGDYTGRVYVVNPTRQGGVRASRRTPPWATSPATSTSRSWRCRPRRCRTSSSTAPPRACTG